MYQIWEEYSNSGRPMRMLDVTSTEEEAMKIIKGLFPDPDYRPARVVGPLKKNESGTYFSEDGWEYFR